MSISLAGLISIGLIEGHSEIIKFVKYFGHYIEINSDNFLKFASKVCSWDSIIYITMDIIDISDNEIIGLARDLNIPFCDRCYDCVIGDVWYKISTLSARHKAELLVPIFDKNVRKIIAQIPNATMGGNGRPVTIEETLELNGILQPHRFAELFGNAVTLNENNFAIYYRAYMCNKDSLARAIIIEMYDEPLLIKDLLLYLDIKGDIEYDLFADLWPYRWWDIESFQVAKKILRKLNSMSLSRLYKAAVEVIVKKLDKAMKIRIAKDKKVIEKQIAKEIASFKY